MLSESERGALKLLAEAGGSMLTTQIEDTNTRNTFGDIIPGHRVFRKLEKLGLVFYTQEEPMDDGFVFTDEIYITEEGQAVLKSL